MEGQIMYYHNGRSYKIGEIIMRIESPFGTVEVAYGLPQDYETWWLAEDDPEALTPRVQAYTPGDDGRPVLHAEGATVYEAVKALYTELAHLAAREDVGLDPHAINGRIDDLHVEERVNMWIATEEQDGGLQGRRVDGKMLSTTIPPEITRARCQKLCRKIGATLGGETVTRLRLIHTVQAGEASEFKTGREHGWEGQYDIQVITDRVYEYLVSRDALLIEDRLRGEYILWDEAGDLCTDSVAIADTLGSIPDAF
jgi:hypothetical protein